MRPVAFLPALLALAVGHVHHDVTREMTERREFLMHSRSNLNHCADKMAESGVEKRAVRRRASLANKLVRRNGIEGRDLTELLDVSHLSEEDYTIDTDPSVLFAGEKSCVLNPEATEGPFYVAGEFVRQDITDDEAGVPLSVDIQIVDVETCEPVSGAYLEIWHCNSTGVYSGVVSAMNGAGLADESNVNATFHRGVQKLDSDGAAQFNTFFPGHYSGRATHIHVMLHMGAEERENGTVSDLTAAHVGQMYFDQDLIDEVEALEPYKSNEQPATRNADDFILAGEAEGADPFMQYVRLGERVEEGLLAWLRVGVNTTYERRVSAAAEVFEEGGRANENAGFGGGCFSGSFPPFPTGTDFPGGFPIPTGTDLPGFPSGFPMPGECEAAGEAGKQESADADAEPEPVEGGNGPDSGGED